MVILPVSLFFLLAVLVYRGERMPRSWLWLAGALFAASVALPLTPLGLLFLYAPLVLVPWIILGVVVLWALVDARPAMAVAIYIACMYLVSPVLGSIGVAPPKKEVVNASSAGAFGGNVDSAAIAVGAKVLLPVYEPGALLFLGHGRPPPLCFAFHSSLLVAGTVQPSPKISLRMGSASV